MSDFLNSTVDVKAFLNSADKNALDFILEQIKKVKNPKELSRELKLCGVALNILNYNSGNSAIFELLDYDPNSSFNNHLTLKEMKNKIIDFVENPMSISEMFDEVENEI